VNPAIIIPAYNRDHSLNRLLKSVAEADYPSNDTPLVISVDKGSDAVVKIAEAFAWNHGPKRVTQHETHLGLKEHILSCGDLSAEYGAVIILEDDLMVSQQFYNYAVAAHSYYSGKEQVAGISLYAYNTAETCFAPFQPLEDGNDSYFMQFPSSWGQLWEAQQWQEFRAWFKDNPKLTASAPGFLRHWSKESWKKHYANYLVDTDQYFVYPQKSHTTNFGEPGVNSDRTGLFQVALDNAKKEYGFVDFNDSIIIYDSEFQLLPRCLNAHTPILKDYEYECDLQGVKELNSIQAPYVLTTRPVANPVQTFGLSMVPIEANIIHNIQGDEIKLAAKGDVQEEEEPDLLKRYYQLNSVKQDLLDKAKEGVRLFSPPRVEQGREYPRISVVVINFELADYLDECLNSIARQGYPNLELIVIDGGSKDKSVDVIKSYESYITKWVSEPDDGAYHAVQKGFDQATGDIMCWISSDDKYLDNSFLAVAGIFSTFSDVNWLMGFPGEFNEKGNILNRINLPWARWSKYRYYTGDFQFIQQESCFWRKELWEKAGAKIDTDYELAADMELWARFFRYEKLYTTMTMLAGFRSREDGTQRSTVHRDQYLSECVDIFRREKALLTGGEKFKVFFLLLLRLPLGIPFFFDIPFLRWFYEKFFRLPEVIQYDAHGGKTFIKEKSRVTHPPFMFMGNQISYHKKKHGNKTVN